MSSASLACADAGVALKLVLPESDSHLARDLWQEWWATGTAVIAPALWGYEVTSVIRNYAHRRRLSLELEEEVLDTVHALPVRLLHPRGLHRRAWDLARRFELPAAYDMHYVALAEMADCAFWTADERLVRRLGSEMERVRWIGDRGSASPSTETASDDAEQGDPPRE